MKNRYEIIKKLYPNHIILIKKKDNYITLESDDKIIRYLNIKEIRHLKKYNINHLILDNLEITMNNNYENNNYMKYYIIVLILDVIKIIRKRVDNYEKKSIINNDIISNNT